MGKAVLAQQQGHAPTAKIAPLDIEAMENPMKTIELTRISRKYPPSSKTKLADLDPPSITASAAYDAEGEPKFQVGYS